MDNETEQDYQFEDWEKKLLRFDGKGNVWSESRGVWLTPKEWAAEKRHRARYRQIMGTHEDVQALNRAGL